MNDRFTEASNNIKKNWKIINKTINHIHLSNDNEILDKKYFISIIDSRLKNQISMIDSSFNEPLDRNET